MFNYHLCTYFRPKAREIHQRGTKPMSARESSTLTAVSDTHVPVCVTADHLLPLLMAYAIPYLKSTLRVYECQQNPYLGLSTTTFAYLNNTDCLDSTN